MSPDESVWAGRLTPAEVAITEYDCAPCAASHVNTTDTFVTVPVETDVTASGDVVIVCVGDDVPPTIPPTPIDDTVNVYDELGDSP